MARDTMKGERNKKPAAKGRMNQGGASMPAKAPARAPRGAAKGTGAKAGAARKGPTGARKRSR